MESIQVYIIIRHQKYNLIYFKLHHIHILYINPYMIFSMTSYYKHTIRGITSFISNVENTTFLRTLQGIFIQKQTYHGKFEIIHYNLDNILPQL